MPDTHQHHGSSWQIYNCRDGAAWGEGLGERLASPFFLLPTGHPFSPPTPGQADTKVGQVGNGLDGKPDLDRPAPKKGQPPWAPWTCQWLVP